jgi:predicted metal-binding membrane protein
VIDEPTDDLDRGRWWRPTSALGRARLVLLGVLAVLTAAAWIVTLRQMSAMGTGMDSSMAGMDMSEMAGMDMTGMEGMAMPGPTATGWSLGQAAAFILAWTVMMAAMMLPAAAPMILVFAAAQARGTRSGAVPTWVFVLAYILVWAAAGILAYGALEIGRAIAGRLDPETLSTWSPRVLGAILVAAGLYQFTPVKRVCLSHCRSPLAFVAQHWRDGRGGALRMGLRHGAYCLGCCWALFAVLTAAGMMSLAWMLLLTLVVFVEKALPYGQRAAPVIGAGFVAAGLVVASGAVPLHRIV